MLSHSPSSVGQGEKNRQKSSWAEIKKGRLLTSYCHRQNRLDSGKINLLSRIVRNKDKNKNTFPSHSLLPRLNFSRASELWGTGCACLVLDTLSLQLFPHTFSLLTLLLQHGDPPTGYSPSQTAPVWVPQGLKNAPVWALSGQQLPLGHVPLLQCGVLHGLQCEIHTELNLKVFFCFLGYL